MADEPQLCGGWSDRAAYRLKQNKQKLIFHLEVLSGKKFSQNVFEEVFPMSLWKKSFFSSVWLAYLTAFVFVVLSGCVPTSTGAKSCEELSQDYLAKFNEIMAIMPVETEADIEQLRQLTCEAVSIADQILAQNCGETDSATLAQAQQILDQMNLQCD